MNTCLINVIRLVKRHIFVKYEGLKHWSDSKLKYAWDPFYDIDKRQMSGHKNNSHSLDVHAGDIIYDSGIKIQGAGTYAG